MDSASSAPPPSPRSPPGALVTTQNWFLLNLGSLVPLSMVALALAWLARRPSRA